MSERRVQDAINLIADTAVRNSLSEIFAWLKEQYDPHYHVCPETPGGNSSTPMLAGKASTFPGR